MLPLGGSGSSPSVSDGALISDFSAPRLCLAGEPVDLSGVLERRPERLEGEAGSGAGGISGVLRCRVERLVGDFGTSVSSRLGLA